MIYEIISENFPQEVKIDNDFPKCKCGGEFKAYNNYSKNGKFHGTTAECKKCKEFFCGYDYEDLKNTIPNAQVIRAKTK